MFPDLSIIAELKRCRKAAAIALEDVCLLYIKWHRLLLSFVQIATLNTEIRADERAHEIEILLHQLGTPAFPLCILLFSFAAAVIKQTVQKTSDKARNNCSKNDCKQLIHNSLTSFVKICA